jgi:pimeloyl-ACP methyl ester carboxylesterase
MELALDTGDRIHVLDWGRPEASPYPPLMLIHGLGQTAWTWAPVARRLHRQAHVLAPDLRGHGLSEAPRQGYDLESLGYDLLTVLVGHGYGADAGGPPAVVVGHGFGALVAASAARVQPAAVAGLALVDGGWEDMAEATGQDAAEFLRAFGDPPEILRTMQTFLADHRDYDPRTWDADQERAARASVVETRAGHLSPATRSHVLRGSVEAMFGWRPLEVLGDLAVPILVAVAEAGTADDEEGRQRDLALDDLQAARRSHGAQPLEVVRFPGAGHNLMRYRPDELSATLLRLLSATSGRTPDGPA